jgi:hypothetical protein
VRGRRVPWSEFGPSALGAYAFGPDGAWHAITPNGHGANLSLHDVVEYEDGTITVAPSIKVSHHGGEELWHGYLERGVWRSV